MSKISAQELVPKFLQSSGDEWVLDNDGCVSKEFNNGKVLSLRRFSGVTTGFVVHLEDPNHLLKPLSSFMRYIDDENRLSAKISFRLGRMPKDSGWGKIIRNIHVRAYERSIPWYRAGDAEYADIIDHGSREKITLTDNMNSVLPVDQRQDLKTRQAFNYRSGFNEDGIPDALWTPCWDFAVSAAQGMKEGEFPEFANLQLSDMSFASNNDILLYSGPTKKCEI